MFSRSYCTLFICFVLSFSNIFAASFPINSTSSPHFWIDVNHFVGDAEFTRTELYHSTPLSELTFGAENDSTLASFTFNITITDENGATAFQTTRRKGARALSDAEKNDSSKGIVDQVTMWLKPGRYDYTCEMTDDGSAKTSSVKGTLTVPKYNNSLIHSEPQLASIISKDTTNQTFIKAGRTVFPNPSRKYKYQDSILYFYFEI